MGALPEQVESLLQKALVAELTVIGPGDTPITYPLIPLYDEPYVYMTSSVLFSRKLLHIKRNPRVAVSLTDPEGISASPLPRATIQGNAEVVEHDLHSGWEWLLPLWRKKEPVIDDYLKKRFGIPLFFERSVIRISPTRVYLWPPGPSKAAPRVFELAEAG